MDKIKYIIGIDEVGRGPVAGPVAVGAVLIKKENIKKAEKEFVDFKDSKKLSPKKRNQWFDRIKDAQKEGWLNYKVVFVDNIKIDQFGIAPSIKACIDKSLKQLQAGWESGSQFFPKESLVLLDGGLKAPKEFINQKTIIKGDEKEMVIALASIVAKVTRDSVMCRLAKDYPNYSLEKHKGYGTKAHLEAIKKYGLCEIHRQTFLKKYLNDKL